MSSPTGRPLPEVGPARVDPSVVRADRSGSNVPAHPQTGTSRLERGPGVDGLQRLTPGGRDEPTTAPEEIDMGGG